MGKKPVGGKKPKGAGGGKKGDKSGSKGCNK